MPCSHDLQARLRLCLTQLYGDGAPRYLSRIAALTDRYPTQLAGECSSLWSEHDVILITYGDQISGLGNTPLATLRRFLLQHQLDGLFSTLHILPFFPLVIG